MLTVVVICIIAFIFALSSRGSLAVRTRSFGLILIVLLSTKPCCVKLLARDYQRKVKLTFCHAFSNSIAGFPVVFSSFCGGEICMYVCVCVCLCESGDNKDSLKLPILRFLPLRFFSLLFSFFSSPLPESSTLGWASCSCTSGSSPS